MYLYNAKIYTMENNVVLDGYIKIDGKTITQVAEGVPDKINSDDIDCQGMNLYPGFIDAHTHLGIIENAIGFEGDDSNEQTDPVTPQMRVIDGVNPFDECFKEAYEAGITSVLTSPGSANTVCGQIAAIKTYGRCIDDMVIKNVGIKFALGENPKTVYNDKDETPITRMATVSLIREALYKAKKYSEAINRAQADEDYDMPDYDIKCESLVPLLQKKVSAYFHCHRADDICTAIRIAKEFDINLILVHATEGYKIADIIAQNNVPAIVGPIICDRCKPEMKGLTIENPALMVKDNVKIALCTDHPVIPVQYLFMSAAMAVKGGLDTIEALKSITINAAKICGISDRVGSIEVGKDADIVVYDNDPFDVMATARIVLINGKKIVCK